jgi:Arc/MetJ-type ribon-helix-helix transcriptional regulator
MNVTRNRDLEGFVRDKVRSGEFRSEEAVIEAALARLRSEESRSLEAMIDREFEAYCAREGDDRISLEEVFEATASIPGSMAQAIIDDERADRF